jgi:hypothetical protein
MAPSIASYLTSVPPTSELYVPTQVQRASDFGSDQTTGSTQLDKPDGSLLEGIDWSRLRGYEQPPPRSKKHRGNRSHIWNHGWRLHYQKDGNEYWICKLCQTASRKPPNPSSFTYSTTATSGAAGHLERVHRVGPHGAITVPQSQPLNRTGDQGSIHSYYTNSSDSTSFDREVFRGLLVRLFTIEQIALLKVESAALQDLLIYLQPRCEAAMPTRNTLRSYITSAYCNALRSVETELQTATTKVNLSFDLWASPGRRLLLLGVVAHYLNQRFEPRTILLGMPSMKSAHTAVNIASQLSTLLDHYNLRESFGNAVTDNATENAGCLRLVIKHCNLDESETEKRHVRCIGHIINLVAHQVLFNTDAEAFEHELESTVTAEAIELASWRRKGPIGKLYNIIRYITHSTQRRNVFLSVQSIVMDPLQDQPESEKGPLDLIRDNVTRWNSWYDAAIRTLKLRHAIDEFIDYELVEYHQKVARHERRSTTDVAPPKVPLLLRDQLSSDDWDIIAAYVDILRPMKAATMTLQGNVSTTAKNGITVKGGLWQVLPILGDLMKNLEEARKRHLPVESQQPEKHPTPSSLPRRSSSPIVHRTTRQSQRSQPSSISVSNLTSKDNIEEVTTQPDAIQSREDGDAQGDAPYAAFEHHFSTNINAAWQKADYYYNLTDDTPIYRAAVFLHPRLKWRWFEKHWYEKPEWIEDAKHVIKEMWSEYKDRPCEDLPAASPSYSTTPMDDEDDEWTKDDNNAVFDQLWIYESEPHAKISAKDSPISYWIGKRDV